MVFITVTLLSWMRLPLLHLPVRYVVKEGNAKIDGNQITFTGAGRIVLEAIQNGDLVYAQADPVERIFQIRPATLLAWPQETYRYAGKENPLFKILYDGFLFGDDENLLDRIPRAETPATVDSELGEYPVNLYGGLSLNYTFKYLEGISMLLSREKRRSGFTLTRTLMVFVLMTSYASKRAPVQASPLPLKL